MQSDVDEARSHLNVSEWNEGRHAGGHAARMVRSGEMPLWYYLPMHPDAQLSATEKEALAKGLFTSLGGEGGHHHEDHDDDD